MGSKMTKWSRASGLKKSTQCARVRLGQQATAGTSGRIRAFIADKKYALQEKTADRMNLVENKPPNNRRGYFSKKQNRKMSYEE